MKTMNFLVISTALVIVPVCVFSMGVAPRNSNDDEGEVLYAHITSAETLLVPGGTGMIYNASASVGGKNVKMGHFYELYPDDYQFMSWDTTYLPPSVGRIELPLTVSALDSGLLTSHEVSFQLEDNGSSREAVFLPYMEGTVNGSLAVNGSEGHKLKYKLHGNMPDGYAGDGDGDALQVQRFNGVDVASLIDQFKADGHGNLFDNMKLRFELNYFLPSSTPPSGSGSSGSGSSGSGSSGSGSPVSLTDPETAIPYRKLDLPTIYGQSKYNYVIHPTVTDEANEEETGGLAIENFPFSNVVKVEFYIWMDIDGDGLFEPDQGDQNIGGGMINQRVTLDQHGSFNF